MVRRNSEIFFYWNQLKRKYLGRSANESNRFAKFKNHWATDEKFLDNEMKKGLQGMSYVATAPR